MEMEMIRALNKARTAPASYIPLLQEQLNAFVSDKEVAVIQNVLYETNEGKSAWLQAKTFLEQQPSLPALQLHPGLHLSAEDHTLDLIRNNLFGHTGSDGSNFTERILKHCEKSHGAMAEIIGADFSIPNSQRKHPELTVLGLIIDDGVSSRGHRKAIFSPTYRYVGCQSGVQNDKIISVFNLAENSLKVKVQKQKGRNSK